MRLELGNIEVKDIVFGDELKLDGGTLTVNKQELIDLVLEDDHLVSCDIDIAKPGESTRITPVKDVVEPRVKVDGPGGVFPGFLSPVDMVGSGRTHVLKGCAVMTAGPIVGFQEGIVDMSGPGAEFTPFSKLVNLVLIIEPNEGLQKHEHEKAIRLAGFKVAAALAEAGRDVEPDEILTYETKPL